MNRPEFSRLRNFCAFRAKGKRPLIACSVFRSRTSVAIAALMAVIFWFVGCSPSLAQDGDLAERLNSIWKRQQAEIVTAHIRYRLFRSGSALAPLSHRQVESLINSFDPVTEREKLADIIRTLHPTSRSNPPWGLMESCFDGARNKEVSQSGIQVFNGQEKIEHDNDNRQVMLFSPGISKLHIRDLSEFRYIPQVEIGSVKVAAPAAGYVVLDTGQHQITADDVTGAVYSFTAQSTEGGPVVKAIIQKGFAAYPGDIIFPQLAAQATYTPDGQLSSISISLIEEAQFNFDLPDETFAVPVSAKTKVFDFRSSKQRSFQTGESVNDVALHANSHAKNSGARRTSLHIGWIVGLLVFVVIGVLSIALIPRFRRG